MQPRVETVTARLVVVVTNGYHIGNSMADVVDSRIITKRLVYELSILKPITKQRIDKEYLSFSLSWF